MSRRKALRFLLATSCLHLSTHVEVIIKVDAMISSQHSTSFSTCWTKTFFLGKTYPMIWLLYKNSASALMSSTLSNSSRFVQVSKTTLTNTLLEILRSSLKSVLSLRFEEIPDYNFYINAMKQGFRDALNETMPVSPPTFKNSNQSDSLTECDELLE